jgi:hypothetical protein
LQLSNANSIIRLSTKRLQVRIVDAGNDDNAFIIEPAEIQIKGARRSIEYFSALLSSDPVEKVALASHSTKLDSVLDISATVELDIVTVMFNVNIFRFIRHIIRVYNWFSPSFTSAEDLSVLSTAQSKVTDGSHTKVNATPFAISAVVLLQKVIFSAKDRALDLSSELININTSATIFSDALRRSISEMNQPTREASLKHTLTWSVAKASLAISERSIRNHSGVFLSNLLLLDILDISGHFSLGHKHDTKHDELGLAVKVGLVGIRIPKSLLKLHTVFEKLGDESIREYDFLLAKVVNEWNPMAPNTPLVPKRRKPELTAEVVIETTKVESDLLASLSCIYTIQQATLTLAQKGHQEVGDANLNLKTTFSGAIRSHTIFFRGSAANSYSVPNGAVGDPDYGASVVLPSAMFDGTLTERSDSLLNQGDRKHLATTLNVDVIEGTIDVHLLDQLVTTQSRLGAEINDITELIMFYTKQSGPVVDHNSESQFLYTILLNLAGAKVSASSPSGSILFESGKVNGWLSNTPQHTPKQNFEDLKWKFSVTGIGLSLLQLQSQFAVEQSPLAYIMIDLKTQNYLTGDTHTLLAIPEDMETYNLQFDKFHAVMHPIALEKLIEIFLYYKKELELKSDRRAREINSLKENTERFFKSLNIPMPQKVSTNLSFLDDKAIILEVAQIGIAIPLDADADQRLPNSRLGYPNIRIGDSFTDGISPAILLSARDIYILTSRLATSGGQVRDLCLQFVKAFDKTNERSFRSSSHIVNNRIVLQDINAKVDQEVKGNTIFGSLTAGIKGFDLQVDATFTGRADWNGFQLPLYSLQMYFSLQTMLTR